MKHTTIAVDLAQSVFQVAVSHRPGHLDEERRLARDRLLGRPLYSAERENGRLVLLVESDDVCVVEPQYLRDVVRGAVAEPNPHKLRRSATQRQQVDENLRPC